MTLTLHTYVIARLDRWAHWRRQQTKFGVGPTSARSWWFPVVMRGNVKRVRDWDKIETDDDECFETEKAVAALSVELRETIYEHFVKGGTAEQQKEALHVKSTHTIYDRLNRAYPILLGMFNDVAAGLEPHE